MIYTLCADFASSCACLLNLMLFSTESFLIKVAEIRTRVVRISIRLYLINDFSLVKLIITSLGNKNFTNSEISSKCQHFLS